LDRHSRPRSWQSVMISKFRGRRCGAGCGRRGSGCLALNEQQDRQPASTGFLMDRADRARSRGC
jgi:hypothetical protein